MKWISSLPPELLGLRLVSHNNDCRPLPLVLSHTVVSARTCSANTCAYSPILLRWLLFSLFLKNSVMVTCCDSHMRLRFLCYRRSSKYVMFRSKFLYVLITLLPPFPLCQCNLVLSVDLYVFLISLLSLSGEFNLTPYVLHIHSRSSRINASSFFCAMMRSCLEPCDGSQNHFNFSDQVILNGTWLAVNDKRTSKTPSEMTIECESWQRTSYFCIDHTQQISQIQP